VGCLSCAFKIIRDKTNFVQNSIIFISFNKIKSEQNISVNIDSTKKADHILEMPGLGIVINVSKILHGKVGWQMNAAYYFYYQRQ